MFAVVKMIIYGLLSYYMHSEVLLAPESLMNCAVVVARLTLKFILEETSTQ